MSETRCLNITKKISELAEQVGKSKKLVVNLVALWQKENNQSMDAYPSIEVLKELIEKHIKSKDFDLGEENERMVLESFENEDFTPERKYDSYIDDDIKLSQEFDSSERKRIVKKLAKLFNIVIERKYKEQIARLSEALKEDPNNNELLNKLESLSKMDVINEYGLINLMNELNTIFNDFVDYYESGEEAINELVQREINSKKSKNVTLTEKQARNYVDNKYNQYKKISEYFLPLFQEASSLIERNDKIKLSIKNTENKNIKEASESEAINNEDSEDALEKEENYKEGWQINARQTSQRDSVSIVTRRLLNNILLTNARGEYILDDEGDFMYLDSSYVHGALLNAFIKMENSDDLETCLEEFSNVHKWAKQILNIIRKNPQIKSQFYQDFRKAALNYWIQVTKNNGKVITVKSNKLSGYYYIIDKWRDNTTSGTIVTENEEDSVYKRQDNIILFRKNVAERHLSTLNKIRTSLLKNNSINSEGNFTEEFKQFINILNSIGIDADPYLVANVFNDDAYSKTRKSAVVEKVNVILSGIKKGEMDPKVVNDETLYPDFINIFDDAFSKIANNFAICDDTTIETMAREGDKSYYTYSNPSYLNKIINLLRGDFVRFSETNDKYGEEYLKELEKQYGQFKYWFKTNDGKSYMNHWLALLTDKNEDGTLSNKAKKYRSILEHKVLLNRDGVEYTDMLKPQYNASIIQEFFSVNNSNKESIHSAWYYVPILSDAPSSEFIKFVMYDQEDYKEIIINQLTDLVKQEIKRISLVSERKRLMKENPNLKPIANFDTGRGERFCFIPQLNNLTYEEDDKTLSFIDKIKDIMDAEGTKGSVNDFIKNELRSILNSEFEEALSKWEELNIYDKKNRPTIDGVVYTDNEEKNKEALNKKLEIYFYNSYLATSQIIQLTTTDLAFYKSVEDLQKRYKEVHSPTQRIDTKAVFNYTKKDGTIEEIKLGKDLETHIVLKDEFVSFNEEDLKVLEDILDRSVKRKELSESDKKRILSEYKSINITDAQAYRTLDSYMSIMAMSGKMTNSLWDAYNRIKSGKILMSDFNLFLQTLKPFVFTQQLNVNSGVKNHPYLKVPLQHKNSEMVLLSIYSTAIASALKNNSNPTKLQALNQFMVDNNIDLVNFESAVKVGLQGAIDLSDKTIEERKNKDNISTYEATLRILREQTGFNKEGGIENNKGYNSDIVHQLSYEDYGIATATHEHLLDLEQLEGSQIRKLIIADLPESSIFNVGNLKLTKSELIDLYNKAHFLNIQDEFEQLAKDFQDPKKLQQILKDEIKSNDRYSKELLNLLSLDENGEFVIPFYEPTQSSRIQALLSSIVKSRIIKQKIKGGSCIQCSNFGHSDDLKFKFDTYTDEEGNTRHKIKYMEVYMPAYSKKFFKPFMDPKTGEIDINRMPEELKNCLGYRVPTEDKYSALTIRIKGFMPAQNGSAIMLPTGITTMTGSDFDVDKLYIMLPEFRTIEYDYKKAYKDFRKNNEKENRILKALFSVSESGNANEIFDEILNTEPEFKEWFAEHKSDYKLDKPIFEKIKYDTKNLEKNNKAARNNLILDIMTAILRNEDLAVNQLNPGGFVEQTKASKIHDILEYSNLSELLKELNCKEEELEDKLNSLSVKELKQIQEKLVKEKSPLNPLTQVDLFELTMTGASSIGMYANYNSAHAVLQHTDLQLAKPIEFLGTSYQSLHEVKSPKDGSFITRIVCGFLSGSVDNVKENLLAGLNQDMLTIPPSMLLANLGVPVREISLFINQPFIKHIQAAYNNSDSYKTVEELIEEYKNSLTIILDGFDIEFKKYTFRNIEENKKYSTISKSDLALAIAKQKRFTELYSKYVKDKNSVTISEKEEIGSYINLQLKCLGLFDYLLKVSEEFKVATGSVKFDTQNGAGGPNISDFYDKIDKMQDIIKNGFKYLDNYEDIVFVDNMEVNQLIKEDYDRFKKSTKIPLQKAFYYFGIYGAGTLFRNYFPFGNNTFRKIKAIFEDRSSFLNTKSLDKIYNELFAFILSDTDFFGDKNESREKQDFDRSNFINNFPFYFNSLRKNNPELKEYEFIRRLKFNAGNERNPIPTIIFKNVGSLNSELRYNIAKEWESLLFSDNPEYVSLAINLFKYCYYRNGFGFGPNSFIHLAPTILKLNIPEYIDKLKSIKDLYLSPDKIQQFYIQYCLNHPFDYKIVKPYKSKDNELIKELLEVLDKSGNGKVVNLGNISRSIKTDGSKRKYQLTFTGTNPETTISDNLLIKIMYELNSTVFSIDGKLYYVSLEKDTNSENIEMSESSQSFDLKVVRLKRLGIDNNFLEYSFNRDALDDFESVIDKEKVMYLKQKKVSSEMSDDIPPVESYNVTTKNEPNLGIFKRSSKSSDSFKMQDLVNDEYYEPKRVNELNELSDLEIESDKSAKEHMLLDELIGSDGIDTGYDSRFDEMSLSDEMGATMNYKDGPLPDLNDIQENGNYTDAEGKPVC